jgi:hypothetical protein
MTHFGPVTHEPRESKRETGLPTVSLMIDPM